MQVKTTALDFAIRSMIDPRELDTDAIIKRAEVFETYLRGNVSETVSQHPPGSVAAEIEASIIPGHG